MCARVCVCVYLSVTVCVYLVAGEKLLAHVRTVKSGRKRRRRERNR